MKHFCVLTRPKSNCPIVSNFSEQEILDLQDLFLTCGCNYLMVPTVMGGRRIINTFLESFRFSRVACLSTLPQGLSDDVIRLYDEMALEGALAFSHHELEDFVLNHLNYDFLWIECTNDLINLPWFYYFEQKLLHDIAAYMPILFVSYANQRM